MSWPEGTIHVCDVARPWDRPFDPNPFGMIQAGAWAQEQMKWATLMVQIMGENPIEGEWTENDLKESDLLK